MQFDVRSSGTESALRAGCKQYRSRGFVTPVCRSATACHAQATPGIQAKKKIKPKGPKTHTHTCYLTRLKVGEGCGLLDRKGEGNMRLLTASRRPNNAL